MKKKCGKSRKLPPTCTLPALTNCSQHSYNRLYDRLDRPQPEDQGGFRSYQALDHLATYRLIEQKCQEWCIKIWVATMDFMKACDSTSHKSPRKAPAKSGIERQSISLLRKLYAEQKGTVSKGDIFSSLLFNIVLQMAQKDNARRWQKIKGMGICSSDSESDCFTNLRCAEDVLEGRIDNQLGQDENSQQPKFKQKKRSGDQQHQS